MRRIRTRCLLCILSGLIVAVALLWLLQFLWLQREIRALQRLSASDIRLITFRLSHRWGVGNEMFALASTYGIKRSHGPRAWDVCIDPRAKILTVFRLDQLPNCRADTMVEYLDAEERREFAYGFFDKNLYSLDTKRHMVVGPFLQSWKYFDRSDREIRRLFDFKASITNRARDLLVSSVEKHFSCSGCFSKIVKIGVHVRRGNMAVRPELIKLGYIVADAAYLDRAMTFYRKNIASKRTIFVVCSDNMPWCEETLSNHTDVIFMQTGLAELDMAILSMCNNSIITVGTFGWWAAWLANGTTVYYKDWPRDGSPLDQWTNHKDYFPPAWIGL